MKKIINVLLFGLTLMIFITGCGKKEEKDTPKQDNGNISVLTDQEALAVGKELYYKARDLKRNFAISTGKVNYKSFGFEDGICPTEDGCYQILEGYEEYANTFLTKEVIEQFINEDENISRYNGEIKFVRVLGRPGSLSSISEVDLVVRSKENNNILFDVITYYCDNVEDYSESGICEKEDIRSNDTTRFSIVKENGIWKVKEATISFK